MMKSSLLGLFLLILLSGSTVSGLGSVLRKYYAHISTHLTWQEAQRHCRSSRDFTDLAIIYTQSDTDQINMEEYNAWIGLHKPESTTYSYFDWDWVDGEQNYLLHLWAANEPSNGDRCAYVNYNHWVYGTGCESVYFFYCYNKGGREVHYTFIPQSKTMSEAGQYCRDMDQDLACFSDRYTFNKVVERQDFPVWTGLHRDGQTWKWSTGASEYRNWAASRLGGNGDCVSISSVHKDMSTQDCSARFPFVCFKDNVVLVKENKTWEEALEHCQELNYRLVSAQPGEDHKYMINRVMEADTEEVWAGLRFLAGHWLWVNGADMLYSDLPVCPVEQQHCGALSKNHNNTMMVRDCTEKMNFLCYS